jgi:uncharacterized protein with ParB-like and HNH nuclease domain
MNFSSSAIQLSSLFNDQKIYSVLPFQRSYSWKKDQVEELYNDITEIEGDNEYFLGTMVFAPHEDKAKLTILVGQQRFASIFLILSALREALDKSNLAQKEFWIEDINKILFKRATPNIEKRSKLELNKEDRNFFEEIILNKTLLKVDKHSHNLIKTNYEFLFQKLKNGIDASRKNYVENVLDVIYNKLSVIKIEVNNEVNANLLFETLNDRGLDLSAADLIKNYIFSLADNNIESVSKNWDRMSDQIGDNNISRFLRHYWISTYDFVRKENLYKSIKQKISKTMVKKFSEEIATEANVYSNIISPTPEFWEDKEIINLLNELNILRVEQVNILLLAVSQKYFDKKDRLKRIIRSLVNFTFRYNTIAGLDPKVLENLYGTLAINCRLDKINQMQIIEKINQENPSKELFEASFKEFETRNRKLSKYILVKIDEFLMNQDGINEFKINIENVNLEHIIPKNPNSEWNKFLKTEHLKIENVLYLIGNQTILYKEYNREIANSFFDEKLKVYKKSKLPINQKLSRFQKFGGKEISKRQSELAQIANEVWQV